VIFCAFHSVGNHGSRFHNEGPIAGLGEEEFAGGLSEGAIQEGVGLGRAKATCQLDHADGGDVEVGIDPRVRSFEPNGPVTLVAP
jgi:hypothetical protein